MPIKLHINTWKIIIEALIPTTRITSQQESYDELINLNFEKSNFFLVCFIYINHSTYFNSGVVNIYVRNSIRNVH